MDGIQIQGLGGFERQPALRVDQGAAFVPDKEGEWHAYRTINEFWDQGEASIEFPLLDVYAYRLGEKPLVKFQGPLVLVVGMSKSRVPWARLLDDAGKTLLLYALGVWRPDGESSRRDWDRSLVLGSASWFADLAVAPLGPRARPSSLA